MPAIFNQNIRSYVNDAFLNSVRIKQPAPWTSATAYILGDTVSYSNRKYIASNSGTSGATPPTHTTGEQSDGAVYWIYLDVLPVGEAYKGNLYAFVGRNYEWTNENSPPAPANTDENDYTTFADMISFKKLTISDLRFGIQRNNWFSGEVYDQYDSAFDVVEDYSNPFYVLTDENHIYKCINNNNGAVSTSKPTGTATSIITLIDGYSWKYIASMSSSDSTDFLTDDFIPIEYKTYDDFSDQWDVQQAAVEKSISTFAIAKQTGTFTTPSVTVTTTSAGVNATATATKTGGNVIKQILINNIGSGYSKAGTYAIVKENAVPGSGATATATIVGGIITLITVNAVGSGYTSGAIVLITGDGAGATATATIAVDDSIQSIAVNLGGTGYTNATIHIIPGTAGAVGTPIMAPLKGHGNNAVSELGAIAAIINVRLASNEHLLTGVTSDFRQVGIITDLRDAANDFADEIYYIGPGHAEFTNGGSTLNKIKANSGNLLYISNVVPVIRSASQEERIKIAIIF
jgi:hypothetical protein